MFSNGKWLGSISVRTTERTNFSVTPQTTTGGSNFSSAKVSKQVAIYNN